MDAGANSWPVEPIGPFEQVGLAEQIAGALDWWRDAGVDSTFDDEPRRWLSADPPAPARTKPGIDAPAGSPAPARERNRAPEPAAPPQIDATDWPTDLAAFTDWWMHEPWLDAGRTQGRVPPRGVAGARLMLLVPQPEAEDRETLLSGPQGRLATAMLSAMGIAPAEAYVASALPRHTPAVDWAEIGMRGLGAVLRHHIRLAAPQRVIALGDTVLPLLGNDPPNITAVETHIAVGQAAIPLLVLRSLEGLLARPAWKADAWRKWLAWTR